jgi:hypothetical protein
LTSKRPLSSERQVSPVASELRVCIFDRRWHGWAVFEISKWVHREGESVAFVYPQKRGWIRVPRGWKYREWRQPLKPEAS